MTQDSSQTDESPSSTRSDLVEVVCEPTNNKVKSSITQDQSLTNEWIRTWYANWHLKKVAPVPVVTGSEAGRLLAARIPPELFDDILFYVNVDRISQRKWSGGKYLKRNQGEPSTDDILADLKRCTLVCLFWANRCRQHMFSGRTLEIKAYQDAEIFRQYISGGSSRLISVHQLINGIYATQRYDRQRSFLHLLYVPVIKDKLQSFSITGPVPDDFGPAKLDTPHWGIPPCMVAPSSFLQKQVLLHHIHLPSFHHVTKYIKHFCCATDILFESITWDGQTPRYSLPHASNTIARQRRPHSLSIRAVGVCTNSVHLALTAVMMNANCPLHRLSDEERMWMTKFMTLLWGHEKEPRVSIGFDVSEQTTTMHARPFHFVFEETSAPTDRSASALSVLGMHAYIHEYNKLPANLDALVNHARTYPTIRAFVVLFDSFALLQESMKPFVEVLGPATEAIEFVCAYEEQEEIEVPRGFWRKTGRVLGVDPVTLEPTGRIWADLQAEWIRNKSSEILRRELKKRR